MGESYYSLICLASTLQRLLNLCILLIQALASLFGERVLETIGGVVSSKNVDRGVESAEGWLSSNFWKPTVVRHEVDHFFLHVFSKVFHVGSPFGEPSGNYHVFANLGCVFIVLERQTPVTGKLVFSGLRRNDNFSRCSCWEHYKGSSSSPTRTEKITTACGTLSLCASLCEKPCKRRNYESIQRLVNSHLTPLAKTPWHRPPA